MIKTRGPFFFSAWVRKYSLAPATSRVLGAVMTSESIKMMIEVAVRIVEALWHRWREVRTHRDYETFLSAILHILREAGGATAVVMRTPEELRWAGRAVREGMLAWA